MARQKPADSGEKKTPKLPVYTVVEVAADGTFTVLASRETAKNQYDAMDAVMARRPEAERQGSLAAFLANSFKGKAYKSKQTVVTESENFDPLTSEPPVSQ